jgi:thiol:disulfide interchange protein
MPLDSTLNYWVSRNGQTFGPYSAEEVHRYVDSGNIAATDHLRSERDVEWATVAQSLEVDAPPAKAIPVAAVVPDDVGRGLAITSLVLGLVGIFAFMCVPCVLNLAGLVLAIVVSRNDEASRTMSLASVFVNLFGLLLGIVGVIAAVALLLSVTPMPGGA